jgi:hypothetical protein
MSAFGNGTTVVYKDGMTRYIVEIKDALDINSPEPWSLVGETDTRRKAIKMLADYLIHVNRMESEYGTVTLITDARIIEQE